MPHKKGSEGFSTSSLTYGSKDAVNQLLELGVVDAQALNFGRTSRLTSKLGLAEIARANEEAQRIAGETGETPLLYGRRIVEVVRVAAAARRHRTDEALDQKVEDERARLYRSMAESVAPETGHMAA